MRRPSFDLPFCLTKYLLYSLKFSCLKQYEHLRILFCRSDISGNTVLLCNQLSVRITGVYSDCIQRCHNGCRCTRISGIICRGRLHLSGAVRFHIADIQINITINSGNLATAGVLPSPQVMTDTRLLGCGRHCCNAHILGARIPCNPEDRKSVV